MTTLGDVADMLKTIRKGSALSQSELANRAGVARTTVARMETVARGEYERDGAGSATCGRRLRLKSGETGPRTNPRRHSRGTATRAAGEVARYV